MTEKGRLSKRLLFPLVGLLLAGLLVVGGIWRPWHDAVMTVTVSLSTDKQGPIEVYERRVTFASSKDAKPLTAYIDTKEWKGELVRLDIRGEIEGRGGAEPSQGFVACSAQLVKPTGVVEPIEFVGWENDGSHRWPFHAIGSPAFAVPGEGESPFVYGKSGLLWHVLRVPEEAVLRVAFRPVQAEHLTGESNPVIPSLGAQRLPFGNPRSVSAENTERPPDVFIYLVDALRADHLGCYGYSRPTSPAIDAFAETAILYEQAQTNSTWTRASVATLLTGLYPSAHGVMHMKTDKLAEWPTLISEALKEEGYRTCSITTNSHTTEPFGFTQGIDVVRLKNLETPDWVNSRAADFLVAQKPEQPVYIYLHTVEPHSPYAPKPETFQQFDRGFEGSCDGSVEALSAKGWIRPKLSTEDIQHLIDLYDAEVFDNDTGFADFLNLLRLAGRFDNALIILVADHGECFLEHDTIQHGRTLNREELQVPLIIKFPGGRFAGLRVKERVSLVDIFPTVLAQAGADPELGYPLPGADLARIAKGPALSSSRQIYAEQSQFQDNSLDLVCIIDEDGYKRVMDMSVIPGKKATEKSVGLWDTHADPDERVDLTKSLPVRAAYHEQEISRFLVSQKNWRAAASAEKAPSVEMTEEIEKNLRALGYLK